ncbi:uncharacterized protein LOC143377883 [Andrena cerasifolii]|uniref:uncharacterized protein LOC143377883 n=1 Tax=Andrena cerasifolii TaxID=2819439 RepID=UPI004037855E
MAETADMDCESLKSSTSSKRYPLKRKDTDPEPCHSKQRKKRCDNNCSGDEEESEAESSPIEDLLEFSNEIDSGLSPKGIKYLKRKIREAYAQFQHIDEENISLKRKISDGTSAKRKLALLDNTVSGVVESLSELRRQISSSSNFKSSYAQKASMPSKLAQEQASKPARHVVTVYPKDNTKFNNSEETKMAIMSSVLPAKEKLKIRNVRKINNNGILIETATKDDLNTVLNSGKLDSAGLMASHPTRKRPRMIISNIPKEMEDKDLLTAIKQQNLKKISKTKFAEDFKLSFKTGDRKRNVINWVVEVSPEIRKTLLQEKRVYIEWHACRGRG